MVLQIITAFIGVIAFSGFGAGALLDEENYLENMQSLEQIIEEKAKDRTTFLSAKRKQGIERAKSNYKLINRTDKTYQCCNRLILSCIEYGHLVREKIVSAETQKEELVELIEKVRVVLQVLKDTYQHEKEERKLNCSSLEKSEKGEDYEVLDKEIVELEQEKEEWQSLLIKLENKLSNLQGQKTQVQAQILQPVSYLFSFIK